MDFFGVRLSPPESASADLLADWLADPIGSDRVRSDPPRTKSADYSPNIHYLFLQIGQVSVFKHSLPVSANRTSICIFRPLGDAWGTEYMLTLSQSRKGICFFFTTLANRAQELI